MGDTTSQQKVEVPQGGGVERKEGLAKIAREILEKIFRNTVFEKFYESIREKCNLVYSGKGTRADLDSVVSEIEKHEKEISKTYPPEMIEIAGNYLRKFKQGVEEAAESKAA